MLETPNSSLPRRTKPGFLALLKNNLGQAGTSFILPLVIILLLLGVIVVLTFKNANSANTAGTDERVNVQPAKAKETLNKEFTFPIKDANGKEVSKIKYTLQNAELRDEIIVKGQKATAIKGRTFLILNLKLTNDYTKPVQINARDYVRLIVNNSSEKLAPDIHNDPVEVQAISTKLTRIGFPINDRDQKLVLQVGEISGKKTDITLHLK